MQAHPKPASTPTKNAHVNRLCPAEAQDDGWEWCPKRKGRRAAEWEGKNVVARLVALTRRVPGAYSNSAIAIMPPRDPLLVLQQERVLGIKIARAMLSGPREISKDATVAGIVRRREPHHPAAGHERLGLLSRNMNEIGNVPMCADPMVWQWMMDIMAKKPKPTNTAPGLIICCAVLRSTAIPIRSIEQVQLSLIGFTA